MRGARARTIGRLTKRPEFLAAAAGRRFHTERMTLQGRLREASDEISGLRFGFTVTKKVGHATERNRIKRRLRAAANDAGAGHADKPLDVVVIGRREALSAAYDVLLDDIDRGLKVVMKPKSPRPGPAPSLPTGDASRRSPHA
jgi:ribonuclease P protein component